MVIAAHPDDAEFGPAGTAARWIDAGSEGWLVCCTSGDQGGEDPDADPLELAALRETRAAGRRRDHRLRRRHASSTSPTARSPTTSPCASCSSARSGRSGPDAVLATDPETIFYRDGGVNHTDHRAAGHGRGRRRLSGGAQPDGLPVARPRRPGRPQRPPALPVLVGPARRLGRRLGDARPQDRRAARARQPDPRAGRPRPSGSATWAAEEGAADRGRPPPRRCASSSSTTTRTRDPADAAARAAAGQALLEQQRPDPAPVVPDLGQAVGAPAEHRRPARPGSGRRRRPARYSSAATSTLAEQLGRLGLGRPVADPHRVEARRSRGPATGRAATDALVDPAAQAVEPIAERRQRLGDVAVLARW